MPLKLKFKDFFFLKKEPSVVALDCNPSIWKAEAGRLFEASLGYRVFPHQPWLKICVGDLA